MRIWFIVIFLLLFNTAQAQKALLFIESKDGFSNIQGQTLGDSIFLTYHTSFTKSSKNFNSMLVTPEGKSLPLSLPELHKKTLLAATQSPDTLCIYYIDKNDAEPTALMLHKANFGRKLKPTNLKVDGQLTAVFVDKALIMVTVNRTTGTMSFIEIKNGLTSSRQNFSVKDDAENLSKLKTAVIRHDNFVRPGEAYLPVKIYLRDDFYYVTLEYPENKGATYVVLNLNKNTGKVSRWKFHLGNGRPDVSSFVAGNKLIRVTKDKNFNVAIYDIEKQQVIDSFLITKKSPVAKQSGIVRNDRNKYVSNQFPIKKILKGAGNGFVVGYEADYDLLLKLGTHSLSAPYIPMISGVGLIVQTLTAMASIAVSLNASDNLDQYFYVAWDGNSYYYVQDPGLAESSIDEFELSRSILFKGYLDGKTTSYGIYQFDDEKLWVHAFKR